MLHKVAHTVLTKNPHSVYGFEFRLTVTETVHGFTWSVFYQSKRHQAIFLPPFIYNDATIHESSKEAVLDCIEVLTNDHLQALSTFKNFPCENKSIYKALREEKQRLTAPKQLNLFA